MLINHIWRVYNTFGGEFRQHQRYGDEELVFVRLMPKYFSVRK